MCHQASKPCGSLACSWEHLVTSGTYLQGVARVVHYQLPASADMYVHRCGRTARAGNAGVAVALVTPHEAARFVALVQAS